MKKYCYLLALTALFALAIISSCKKEPPLRVETNTQAPEGALLQQAKEWYKKQFALPPSVAEGAINLKGYTPDWSKAKVVKNSKGQDVVGVPLLSSKEVYMELNVLLADGKAFGLLKKYVLGADKKIQLSLYRAPGDLIVKGYYDRQRKLFMAGKSPNIKLMKERDSTPVNTGEEDDPIGGGGGEEPINGNNPINIPEVVIVGEPIHRDTPSYNFPSQPVGGSGHVFNPDGGNDNGYPNGGGGSSRGNNHVEPVDTEVDPNALDTNMTAKFYKNEKARCALNKLLQNNYYKTALNNFIGENKPIDLTFELAQIEDPLVNGHTKLKPSDWSSTNIELTLNENKINNIPSIEVALTLLHEGIHAEIFRKILSIHGPSHLNIDNFPSLFNMYAQYKGYQHEFIANYYVDIMGNALKQYDNNKFDMDYYKALAWRGLEGTDVYINLNAATKAGIQSKMSTVLSNRSNTNCNDL
ncbi:MAG: hypothetical protein WBP45_14835 [Daejeonella sp.]